VALDTILNQKPLNQGDDEASSSIASMCDRTETLDRRAIREVLEEQGALAYSIVVAATASDPAPMQFLGPSPAARWANISRQWDARLDHLR